MNSGKMNAAAVRLILWSLAAWVGLFAAAWIGRELGTFILFYWKIFAALWGLVLVAVVYLSRDPNPIEPSDINALVSPAHGTVDVIDEQAENDFVKATCQRVSIRVSIWDVHVQYAPVAARVAYIEHHRPLRSGGNSPVETLLLGLEPVTRQHDRIALRLAGGSWGTRIVPWVVTEEVVPRSARLGMMRLGPRVDIFLPRAAKLAVKTGDTVVGGQSVLAKWES
jgi:phosphatidylserine decarboxylase